LQHCSASRRGSGEQRGEGCRARGAAGGRQRTMTAGLSASTKRISLVSKKSVEPVTSEVHPEFSLRQALSGLATCQRCSKKMSTAPYRVPAIRHQSASNLVREVCPCREVACKLGVHAFSCRLSKEGLGGLLWRQRAKEDCRAAHPALILDIACSFMYLSMMEVGDLR